MAESFENFTPKPTSYVTKEASDLIVATFGLVIIPGALKEISKMDEEKKNYKVKAAEYLLVGAEVAVLMYYITQLCIQAKSFYDYCYPSEAQKAIWQAAAEMNKIIDAENGLRKCLLRNMRTPLNDAGLPIACQELANAFGTVAGQPALDEMATNFNDAYGA